jgi:hypothetical protein
LTCSIGGTSNSVTYSYSHSGTEMRNFYAEEATRNGIKKGIKDGPPQQKISGKGQGSCSDPNSYPAEGPYYRFSEDDSFQLDPSPANQLEGRVLCYVTSDNQAVISWYDAPLKIYGSASAPANTGLYGRWADGGHPDGIGLIDPATVMHE